MRAAQDGTWAGAPVSGPAPAPHDPMRTNAPSSGSSLHRPAAPDETDPRLAQPPYPPAEQATEIQPAVPRADWAGGTGQPSDRATVGAAAAPSTWDSRDADPASTLAGPGAGTTATAPGADSGFDRPGRAGHRSSGPARRAGHRHRLRSTRLRAVRTGHRTAGPSGAADAGVRRADRRADRRRPRRGPPTQRGPTRHPPSRTPADATPAEAPCRPTPTEPTRHRRHQPKRHRADATPADATPVDTAPAAPTPAETTRRRRCARVAGGWRAVAGHRDDRFRRGR